MSGQMWSLDQVCSRKYSLLYIIWFLPLFWSLQGYLVLHRNLDKEHLFEPTSKKRSIKKNHDNKMLVLATSTEQNPRTALYQNPFIFSNNFIIICLTCTHLSHPLVQNAKIWVFYLTWLVQLHCTSWPTQLVVLWASLALCMLISIFCPKALAVSSFSCEDLIPGRFSFGIWISWLNFDGRSY